jgi:hypothetical protein
MCYFVICLMLWLVQKFLHEKTFPLKVFNKVYRNIDNVSLSTDVELIYSSEVTKKKATRLHHIFQTYIYLIA